MKKLILSMSIFSIFTSFSCSAKRQPVSDINTFVFHHDGTRGGNTYTYEIKFAEDSATMTYEHLMQRKLGKMTCMLDDKFKASLEALCNQYNIASWDGYNGKNTHVRDGKHFSLNITCAGDRSISAYGNNKFPDHYHEFVEGLNELCKPYVDKMLREARDKQIAKGINGSMNTLLLLFKQRGASGSDSYYILLMRQDIRQYNFEVRINSSGEIFPAGEHTYYAQVDDSVIQWEKLEQVIKKHNIINWYDYEQHSADADNQEWFQLSTSFDGGLQIDAHGTEHPENYDAFRHDILTLLKQIIDEAEAHNIFMPK